MSMQAWWSELVTDGGAPPGRFAHAAVGAGETMYMVGGYAQGTTMRERAVWIEKADCVSCA